MRRKIVIGIDTSNYTTSYAIISETGELVANLKRPLPVKEGERGLRQSDAVFAHIKNLPELAKEAKDYIKGAEILAVGVSERPRNVEGSYMPCFLSGVAVAENIAAALCVPLYRFSHQCGHVMAAIFSSGKFELLDASFAAFHVSGGTTELLRVKSTDNGFDAELIGGTADLNAGQIIDRVGVYMGLPFPSGKYIEELALLNTAPVPKKNLSVKELVVNLSGLENMAKRLFDETGDKNLTSAFLLDYIARAIEAVCNAYIEKYGNTPFVFAGGVMCNSIIKKRLSNKFNAFFAEPAMSADNAVGIAALTLRRYLAINKRSD